MQYATTTAKPTALEVTTIEPTTVEVITIKEPEIPGPTVKEPEVQTPKEIEGPKPNEENRPLKDAAEHWEVFVSLVACGILIALG